MKLVAYCLITFKHMKFHISHREKKMVPSYARKCLAMILLRNSVLMVQMSELQMVPPVATKK